MTNVEELLEEMVAILRHIEQHICEEDRHYEVEEDDFSDDVAIFH